MGAAEAVREFSGAGGNGNVPEAETLEGEEDVENADAGDGAADKWILNESGERVEAEEVVHVPPFGPGKKQNQNSEFNPEQEQGDAQGTSHLGQLWEKRRGAATG